MLIETQNTPNENVMNFFPDRKLIKSGKAEFIDSKSLRRSPLAEKIFDIGGIESIFITEDMLSVTKADAAIWDDLKPQILAEVMEYLATGAEVLIEKIEPNADDIINQIKGLIDARIRPALQHDGGDIVFIRFENGVVFVKLTGNCAGCPYAAVTLKEGVEKILKTYIPEVKSVQNTEN